LFLIFIYVANIHTVSQTLGILITEMITIFAVLFLDFTKKA